MRDLEQLRAKRRPVEPEPQQAPPAPMHVDVESPKPAPRPVPQTAAPEAAARAVKPEAQPAAPFPNMGVEAAAATTPFAMKAMLEARASQPTAAPTAQGDKPPGLKPSPTPAAKGVSPGIKTGSPAPKAIPSPAPVKVPSPAVKTGSPVVKAASPVIKTSASANATPKPATKPTPPPPAPAPVAAPAPAAAAPPPLDTVLEDFFDLTTPTEGPSQPAANAEMNFTDMQFSLDTAPEEAPQPKGADDDEFGLASFPDSLGADEDAFPSLAAAEVAPMDVTMANAPLGGDPKQPQSVPDANMDDLFGLDESGIDLTMGEDEPEMDVSTNFEDLYYQGAETSDFDDSFFKL